MVLPCKQPECDSTNGQENCVSAKPKAVPRQSDEANRGNDQENDTRHQNPANGVERPQEHSLAAATALISTATALGLERLRPQSQSD